MSNSPAVKQINQIMERFDEFVKERNELYEQLVETNGLDDKIAIMESLEESDKTFDSLIRIIQRLKNIVLK